MALPWRWMVSSNHESRCSMSSGESTMTPWWQTSRWWRTRCDPSVSKPSSESFPRLSDPEILLKMTVAAFRHDQRHPESSKRRRGVSVYILHGTGEVSRLEHQIDYVFVVRGRFLILVPAARMFRQSYNSRCKPTHFTCCSQAWLNGVRIGKRDARSSRRRVIQKIQMVLLVAQCKPPTAQTTPKGVSKKTSLYLSRNEALKGIEVGQHTAGRGAVKKRHLRLVPRGVEIPV